MDTIFFVILNVLNQIPPAKTNKPNATRKKIYISLKYILFFNGGISIDIASHF